MPFTQFPLMLTAYITVVQSSELGYKYQIQDPITCVMETLCLPHYFIVSQSFLYDLDTFEEDSSVSLENVHQFGFV